MSDAELLAECLELALAYLVLVGFMFSLWAALLLLCIVRRRFLRDWLEQLRSLKCEVRKLREECERLEREGETP